MARKRGLTWKLLLAAVNIANPPGADWFWRRIDGGGSGVEAAHVKWHQAGGPGSADNGIAAGSLHDNLFDRGAFTLTADNRLEIYRLANGGPATTAQLIGFHAEWLRLPSNPAHAPGAPFVAWGTGAKCSSHPAVGSRRQHRGAS